MRIELARRRKGLTQEALGGLLGLTGGAVSHWESARHEPPRDKLSPLADALDVSVGWLHGESIVSEADRRLEQLLLRLALDGGPELLDYLLEFKSAQELLDYLKARNSSKKR